MLRDDKLREGIIFNIQRYSVHDGPGIRTTIFIKGCPLDCWWCHNPESQSGSLEIMYDMDRCSSCQFCMEKCPEGAVQLIDGNRIWLKEKCILCKNCIENCPAGALELVGKKVSVADIISEVEKDIIFFDESNGGVTISGGEAFVQFEFIKEIIQELKNRDIHIAVDTCGQIDWAKLEELKDSVDLFLYDIKHMDSDKHRQYTGVGNELILENLARLKDFHSNIIIRIPVIPGINDDELNIKKTGKYVKGLGLKKVNLLPYHDIAKNKYVKLGRNYRIEKDKSLSDEKMNRLSEIMQKVELQVKIGG